MEKRLIPLKINNNDTIGVISPSYPYATKLKDRYNRALENLQKLGFKIKVGKYVTTKEGFSTSTPENRAKDINDMFKDPEVKAILCVNGGSVANEVLPFLDYDLIRKNPKIIIGYSDLTSILLGIYSKTGLITFNGPMVIPQFGEFPKILDYTYNSFNSILSERWKGDILPSEKWTDEFLDATKNEDLRPRNLKENLGYKVVKEGASEGMIMGGNLRIICSLVGTPYEPNFKDSILFLEDVSVGTDEIERNLTHLKQAGVFKKIKGIVFGRILMIKNKDNVSLTEVLTKVTQGYEFPIITDIDFGHTDPLLTIPNGIKCRIDSGKITFLEYSVSA